MSEEWEIRSFPEILETERLRIRPPRPGDGAEVNAAIRESYEELHRWMPWADHLPTVEETEDHAVRSQRRFRDREDFPLFAFLKETEIMICASGLHLRDKDAPKFEIGYWRRAGYEGKGYVAETVRAILKAGFEIVGAKRIEIRCDSRNLSSRRVAERTGFRLEGELRSDERAPDGSLRDTLVFSMLPDEYERRSSSYAKASSER